MTRRLLLIIVGALLAIPIAAPGQVCSGLASYARRPFQVVGGAQFNDNAKSFGGGFGFGGTGAFGQLNLATTSFDNVDGSAFTFSGGAGYQVPLDKRNVAQLCPIASVSFASGPNNIDLFGDGSVVVDLSETDVEFGVALGAVASRSGQTQIIPAASLSFVSASAKAKDQVSGASNSQSDTFGLLDLGLGFVFNEVFALRPGVAIPIGLDGASTTFGLTLGLNFGQKSK